MKQTTILISAAMATLLCHHPEADAQIFYKVERGNLPSPSYILGTHHLAAPSVIDSIPMLQDVLDNADVIVGEVDLIGNPMELAATLQRHMAAPADSTISRILPPDDYARVEKFYARYSPTRDYPMSVFDGMKPMALATAITVGLIAEKMPGGMPEVNLDTYIQQEALAAGKRTIALETADQQAGYLYGGSISSQAEQLVALAEDPDHAVEEAVRLNNAYFARDIDSILDLTREDEKDKAFYDLLLRRRNEEWMRQLSAIFAEGNAIVAVGALHLAGEDGLVSRLRKEGYSVTALY